MCVALPVIAVAASVISAGVAAYGAVQQGEAQQKAADYQSAVSRNNAMIAESNAKNAEMTGETQAENQLLAKGQRTAAVRAAGAAAGLDVNAGTNLALQSDTEKLGTLDALTTRNRADQQAYGYRIQGTGDTAQAGLLTAEGSQASTAGNISAFGSVVGGASSVSDKWIRYSMMSGNGQTTGAN